MIKKFAIRFSVLYFLFALFFRVECNNKRKNYLECNPVIENFERFNVTGYLARRYEKEIIIPDLIVNDEFTFNQLKRTVVVVHGYLSSVLTPNFIKLKNELLTTADINVIMVDWNNGCNNLLNYTQAAANTEYVAIRIKRFFVKLMHNWRAQNKSVDSWGSVHFIGHSLGAHIVGQAGKILKRKMNFTVDRITALDPAEPCFETAGMPLRLSKSSAKFVDVIHTDVAVSKNAGLGLKEPLGHVDFYSNGGTRQPGCYTIKRDLDYSELIKHLITSGTCHHSRAVELFTESVTQLRVNTCEFWGYPWKVDSTLDETYESINRTCDPSTCPQMGISAEFFKYNNNVNNTYFVLSTDNSPFCNFFG